MKTKKNKNADLEGKRPLFFTIGLLISLSAVLLAFGWKTPVQKSELDMELKWGIPVEEVMPVTREEKKEIAPPKREAIDFELVTNETVIDSEIEFFNSEIGKDEAVEVRNYVVQATRAEDDEPVWVPDEMPEFPGGMLALLKFISSSVKYPVIAQENGIQGKVIVTFVISKTGEVTNVRVFRGIDPALDAEALRVVNSLPRWMPGKQKGRPVNVNYNVPINFILQ